MMSGLGMVWAFLYKRNLVGRCTLELYRRDSKFYCWSRQQMNIALAIYDKPKPVTCITILKIKVQ